jgi:hypothetical protein
LNDKGFCSFHVILSWFGPALYRLSITYLSQTAHACTAQLRNIGQAHFDETVQILNGCRIIPLAKNPCGNDLLKP